MSQGSHFLLYFCIGLFKTNVSDAQTGIRLSGRLPVVGRGYVLLPSFLLCPLAHVPCSFFIIPGGLSSRKIVPEGPFTTILPRVTHSWQACTDRIH